MDRIQGLTQRAGVDSPLWLHTVYSALHTTPCSVRSTVHSVQCTIHYTVQRVQYSTQCTVHCTLFRAACTVQYTVYSALHTEHSSMQSWGRAACTPVSERPTGRQHAESESRTVGQSGRTTGGNLLDFWQRLKSSFREITTFYSCDNRTVFSCEIIVLSWRMLG